MIKKSLTHLYNAHRLTIIARFYKKNNHSNQTHNGL